MATPWNKGMKGIKGIKGTVPWNKGKKGINKDVSISIPEIKHKTIIQMAVAGENNGSIGRTIGVDRETIRNFKKRHQDAIEKELNRVLDSLPDIVGMDMEEISAARQLSSMIRSKTPLFKIKKGVIVPSEDNPTQFTTIDEVMGFLNYVSKKTDGYKRALGILPSATPAPVLLFINNDNRKQMVVSPMMEKLVESLTGQKLIEKKDEFNEKDDIIDIN